MSKELVINAPKVLGLSNIDIQVYVLLAKDGPHKINEKESFFARALHEIVDITSDLY